MSHEHLYEDDLLMQHASIIEERVKSLAAAQWNSQRANARVEDGWHEEYEADRYMEALLNFATAWAARIEERRVELLDLCFATPVRYVTGITPGGENDYHEVPDNDLPGMWSRSDFEGGIDEVRGPDWTPPAD